MVGFASELSIVEDEVHLWSTPAMPPSSAELAWLTPEERTRGDRFVHEHSRVSHLATRCLIRRTLSRYAPVLPEAWQFGANEWGRPHVSSPELARPLHFNVTHSATHIMMAVSRFAEVGVDVETRLPQEFQRIADDHFTPSECHWMNTPTASAQGDHGHRFLTLWTLKEAYIKACGRGLSMPLQSFSVLPDLEAGASLVATTDGVDQEGWQFWRGALPDALGCWALSARNNRRLKLIHQG